MYIFNGPHQKLIPNNCFAFFMKSDHCGGVRNASGVSTVHFGKNFIKQKLQGTPDLVGQVTFLGHKSGFGSGTWAPCPSGAMVTHYEG